MTGRGETMIEGGTTSLVAGSDAAPPIPGPQEMAPLVARLRAFLDAHAVEAVATEAPGDLDGFAAGGGSGAPGKGAPEVILAEDTGVELGHPSTSSLALVLTTARSDLVRHGRVTRLGPDLDEMAQGTRAPFAQIVLLAAPPARTVDRFDLENAQYLTHRLPGYMVRSVPGRLWARVSRRALASGLRIETIGRALVAVYSTDLPGIERVEVVFVTSDGGTIAELAPIAKEAEILAGRHKKLSLGAGGEVECRDLECESCDEKPACDNLRDIVIRRRERRPGRRDDG